MTQVQQLVQPEEYYLSKGVLVPNNRLPVLVYRDVLPRPVAREAARELCEMNHWEMRGEWGPFWDAHFHPNTHECYAIIEGESKLALGREGSETATGGIEVDVRVGDVIVLPAGVSHKSLTAQDDYWYIGVYPEACPKWRSDWCEGNEDMAELENEIGAVGVPEHDPVYGLEGPLVVLWKKAMRANKL